LFSVIKWRELGLDSSDSRVLDLMMHRIQVMNVYFNTASCISSLFEKQIVRRCSLLIRVRKVKFRRSILSVPSLPI